MKKKSDKKVHKRPVSREKRKWPLEFSAFFFLTGIPFQASDFKSFIETTLAANIFSNCDSRYVFGRGLIVVEGLKEPCQSDDGGADEVLLDR